MQSALERVIVQRENHFCSAIFRNQFAEVHAHQPLVALPEGTFPKVQPSLAHGVRGSEELVVELALCVIVNSVCHLVPILFEIFQVHILDPAAVELLFRILRGQDDTLYGRRSFKSTDPMSRLNCLLALPSRSTIRVVFIIFSLFNLLQILIKTFKLASLL